MFNFAGENDARKAVETFCIFNINIADSNFHAQNVFFPNLQSASVEDCFVFVVLKIALFSWFEDKNNTFFAPI